MPAPRRWARLPTGHSQFGWQAGAAAASSGCSSPCMYPGRRPCTPDDADRPEPENTTMRWALDATSSSCSRPASPSSSLRRRVQAGASAAGGGGSASAAEAIGSQAGSCPGRALPPGGRHSSPFAERPPGLVARIVGHRYGSPPLPTGLPEVGRRCQQGRPGGSLQRTGWGRGSALLSYGQLSELELAVWSHCWVHLIQAKCPFATAAKPGRLQRPCRFGE